MSDESAEVSPELQSKFEAAYLPAFAEHTKEVRRSFEIGAGFYDKLAALSAGSIAIAASVGVSMVVRTGSHSQSFHRYSLWLAFAISSLWISLIGAVGHNYVMVYIARLDADYSTEDFIRTLLRISLKFAAETQLEIDESTLSQLQEGIHEQPLRNQKRIVARKTGLIPVASTLGYLSISTFLVAYTKVAVCVVLVIINVQ